MHGLVEHHTHYKEIHGFDKTVWLSPSEHRILHNKLRREGKCNVPSSILEPIARAAHRRTEKCKEGQKIYARCEKAVNIRREYKIHNRTTKNFQDTIDTNIIHQIKIEHYLTTDTVSISCAFKGNNGRKIVRVDIK